MRRFEAAMRPCLTGFALALAWLSLHAQDPEPFPLYNLKPYLQSLTSTSVLVVCQSKEAGVGRLEYGLTDKLGSVVEETAPVNDHSFLLEGLTPNTRYYYRVKIVDVTTHPRRSFLTLPEPGFELTVAAVGDSGDGSEEQITLGEHMLEFSPHLLLHLGDVAYPYGSPSNYYQKFFKIYSDLLAQTCIYPVLGNHDCLRDRSYFLYAFHLPNNNSAGDEGYYSFDAGDAHFAALNSCEYKVPQEQLDWLEQDLKASTRNWKIVFFHHAPYSNGYHNGEVVVREAVVPVIERNRVDLVLCGHEHVYERTYPVLDGKVRDAYQSPDFVSPRGVIYAVSGGGGAELYPFIPSPEIALNAFFKSAHNYLELRITAEKLECRAIGLEKEVIDQFTITKSGASPPLRFLRGDADEDSSVNVTDGVAILGFLFGGVAPPCLAACDVNSSQSVEITDAVQLLSYLFRGGPPPAAPFPECGTADDIDNTGCKHSCP